MGKKITLGVPIALLSALCLIAIGFIPGNAFATDHHKTQLVGHSDLQGRDSLQLNVKTHPLLGKVFVAVGHHRGVKYNPMTDKYEANGSTILDVTNPKKPVIIVHIPGAVTNGILDPDTGAIPSGGDTAESRATQFAFNHLGSGNDYMIRQQEVRFPAVDAWFEIWDITQTLRDGTPPTLVNTIEHKYPDLIAPSDDLVQAHKGWWHYDMTPGGVSYYFGSATDTIEACPSDQHMIVWDISNLADPKYVASGWIPGQQQSETCGNFPQISLHHPVVDWENDRVHAAYLFGGNVAVFDISSLTDGLPATDPFPVAVLADYNPPFPDPGPHTSLPFYQVDTPNFTEGSFGGYISNPRDFIIVSDEGFGGDTATLACQDVRNHLYSIDITDFDHPVTVNMFKVPDDGFCEAGKSVRPHQNNDTQNGKIYRPGENKNLIFVAYFEKGLRILDYSDPYNPVEVGYFIPDATVNTKTNPEGVTTIMTNDVDLDVNGLAYTSDRNGTGLHIIRYLP